MAGVHTDLNLEIKKKSDKSTNSNHSLKKDNTFSCDSVKDGECISWIIVIQTTIIMGIFVWMIHSILSVLNKKSFGQ